MWYSSALWIASDKKQTTKTNIQIKSSKQKETPSRMCMALPTSFIASSFLLPMLRHHAATQIHSIDCVFKSALPLDIQNGED